MFSRRYLTALIVLGLTGVAGAEEETKPQAGTHTAKERMVDKASDEQRVDNCKVPPERRGAKPRPDCAHQAAQPQ